jgi:ATP-dependent DNA ligase
LNSPIGTLLQRSDKAAKFWYLVSMTKSARATPPGTIPTRRGAEPPPPPTWIKPQLAKLVEYAPDGPDWLHEIKFDGYRMHARLDGGKGQILTRRGNDWTDKYPAIGPARDLSCHVGRILEFFVN